MKSKPLVSVILSFLLVLGVASAANAEMKIADFERNGTNWQLFTEIRAVGALQALDQEANDGSLPSRDPTFNTAYGDLAFRLQMDDYAELYFNTWQASRPHEDRWFGHEGYMRIDYFPSGYPISSLNPLMQYVDVKVGEYEIDYGWYQDNTSLNAHVQQNALVGNPVVKAQATEPGLEIIADETPVKWVAGFGNAGPTTDAQEGRSFSYHGKVWGDVAPGAELAASFYTQDNSRTTGAFGGPSNLFASDRAGGRYGDVWGGGNSPGNVLPGNGFDETAWQIDLRTNPTDRTEFNALYGNVEDADVNGAGDASSPEQSWNHYAAEATYSLNEHMYVASRYSGAEIDQWENTSGVSTSSGEVKRIQLGFGMWVFEGFLAKLEYVDQEASDFVTDAPLGGVNASANPEFNGLITEFSMEF